MSESHAKAGSCRFWRNAAALLATIAILSAIFIWLSEATGWPDAYGFHCRGRGCMWTYLYHSPLLLRGGSVLEVGLFLFLWLMPAALIGTAVHALLRRPGR